MKQQNNSQNLWQLWHDAIRVKIAWLEVTDPEVSLDSIRELKELVIRISPFLSSGGNESS